MILTFQFDIMIIIVSDDDPWSVSGKIEGQLNFPKQNFQKSADTFKKQPNFYCRDEFTTMITRFDFES